jgi:hypothetical protein
LVITVWLSRKRSSYIFSHPETTSTSSNLSFNVSTILFLRWSRYYLTWFIILIARERVPPLSLYSHCCTWCIVICFNVFNCIPFLILHFR